MLRIIACLKAMPRFFEHMDLTSVLTNGKVETHLKTLMGITWVAGQAETRPRSFLMDKKLGGNRSAPLDFLAFEHGIPKFWVEAKCDYLADPSAIKKSAKKAVRQIQDYKNRIPEELRQCPAYVVHFLCELPDEEQYPEWVETFNALNWNETWSPLDVANYYKNGLNEEERRCIGRIHLLNLEFDPPILVVVANGT